MTQALNQFSQTPEVGDLDLQHQGNVFPCVVASTQSTALVPGQAVKMADVAGGAPKMIGLAANTDKSFGFVVRNLKDASFAANAPLEIATGGAVMYMTAGAAIARGANLEVVYTTNKVITNAGTNPIIGQALDKAAADDDIIRVLIRTPAQ